MRKLLRFLLLGDVPLNRYRISGLDFDEWPKSKPWSIEVFAPSADDAWWMVQKNTEKETSQTAPYMVRYSPRRIEAVDP